MANTIGRGPSKVSKETAVTLTYLSDQESGLVSDARVGPPVAPPGLCRALEPAA